MFGDFQLGWNKKYSLSWIVTMCWWPGNQLDQLDHQNTLPAGVPWCHLSCLSCKHKKQWLDGCKNVGCSWPENIVEKVAWNKCQTTRTIVNWNTGNQCDDSITFTAWSDNSKDSWTIEFPVLESRIIFDKRKRRFIVKQIVEVHLRPLSTVPKLPVIWRRIQPASVSAGLHLS